MPQISVIVPVYKVEPYLRRCVDSILAQTFTDFELILVDDGSPDNCGAICDEYAAKDSRVHVIHQENGGLSAARNAGIDWAFTHSDSEWLIFVDSDDWVHPRILETLSNAADISNMAIAACELVRVSEWIPYCDTDNTEIQVLSSEEAYIKYHGPSTVAVAKLYRKSLFKDIRYPVGKTHEDEYITYRIVFSIGEMAIVDIPMYFYFQNSNSITTGCWSVRRLDVFQAYEEQIVYFEQNGYEAAKKRQIGRYLECLAEQIFELETLSSDKYYLYYLDMLRDKLRVKERIYRTEHVLSKSRYIWILEAAYPMVMRMYWLAVALRKRVARMFKKE